jgi:hypothetical protein
VIKKKQSKKKDSKKRSPPRSEISLLLQVPFCQNSNHPFLEENGFA